MNRSSQLSVVYVILAASAVAMITFVGIYVWQATIDIDATNAAAVQASTTSSQPSIPDVTKPEDLDAVSTLLRNSDIDAGTEAALNQALSF